MTGPAARVLAASAILAGATLFQGCVSIICREKPELSAPCRDPKTGRFVACEAKR